MLTDMKKLLFSIAIITGVAGYGQILPDKLELASKDVTIGDNADFLPITVDLTYCSKNYKDVFGEYNYTLDSNNYGQRNVYVGHNDKYYFLSNSTFIMDMQPSGLNSFNFSDNADYLGGLYSAVQLIFSDKVDYSRRKRK